METHKSTLAARLPDLVWLGPGRLPTDSNHLTAALRGIMTRASHPLIREKAREALDDGILANVKHVVDLKMDEGMSAIAFIFNDGSVYMTACVKGKNGKPFSFVAPDIHTARKTCNEFHPGYVPARGDPALTKH